MAVLGLTGTILLWEGDWIGLPGAHDPLREDVAVIGRIVERAVADGQLSRATLASDEIGLHQLVFDDGSGAYVRQSGEVVDRWTSQWERPELWLFDLHHHLFAGDAGETVTGIAGIAGLLFVLTGLVLWWRGRANFRPTLLPKRFSPGPIAHLRGRTHTDNDGRVDSDLDGANISPDRLNLFVEWEHGAFSVRGTMRRYWA